MENFNLFRTSPKETIIDALINGHYEVPDEHSTYPELLSWVLRQVTDFIPEMRHGRTYAIRTLTGEDLWTLMNRRQRGVAEQFLWHLIASECIGLRTTDADDGEEVMYSLK